MQTFAVAVKSGSKHSLDECFLFCGRLLFSRPSPQQPADDDQLTQMVRGMIGHQQGLAQKVLPLAPGKRRQQIIGGVVDQADHLVAIFLHLLNRVLPAFRVGAARPRPASSPPAISASGSCHHGSC